MMIGLGVTGSVRPSTCIMRAVTAADRQSVAKQKITEPNARTDERLMKKRLASAVAT